MRKPFTRPVSKHVSHRCRLVQADADVCAQTLRAVRIQVLHVRPGDILLLRTPERFSLKAIERFHAAWRGRFGDSIKIAILEGDWQVNVLRSSEPRQAAKE